MDISPVDTPCQCQSLLPKMQMILAFWGLFAKRQQRRFDFDNSDFKSGIFCCLVSADFATVAVVAVAWGPHEGHGPTVGSHRRQKTQWRWEENMQHSHRNLMLASSCTALLKTVVFVDQHNVTGCSECCFLCKTGVETGDWPQFWANFGSLFGCQNGMTMGDFFIFFFGWVGLMPKTNKQQKKWEKKHDENWPFCVEHPLAKLFKISSRMGQIPSSTLLMMQLEWQTNKKWEKKHWERWPFCMEHPLTQCKN